MGISDRKVVAGARELRRYLKKTEQSMTSFSEKNGLDRIQILRLMNGLHWKRVSVSFGLSIVKATKGAVRLESFAAETATPVSE